MSLSLFPRFRPRAGRAANRRNRHEPRRLTPSLDGLESRLVLSAMPAAPPAHVAAATQNLLHFAVNSVSVVNGGLMANVSIGNAQLGTVTEQVPVTFTTSPAKPAGPAGQAAAPAAATSSILSLHLAPINLDLLGLDVQTSEICLNITATKGGGLLGNLLYDVNNLLSSGGSLGSLLGSLSGGQLTQLTNGLTNLLNGALSTITSTATTSATPAATNTPPAGSTDVLNLTLGPVNLNLLGLNVTLDNCSGGPITVDIYAIPSTAAGGGLLGNLLIDLNGLLSGATGSTLTGLETLIDNEIRSLI